VINEITKKNDINVMKMKEKKMIIMKTMKKNEENNEEENKYEKWK